MNTMKAPITIQVQFPPTQASPSMAPPNSTMPPTSRFRELQIGTRSTSWMAPSAKMERLAIIATPATSIETHGTGSPAPGIWSQMETIPASVTANPNTMLGIGVSRQKSRICRMTARYPKPALATPMKPTQSAHPCVQRHTRMAPPPRKTIPYASSMRTGPGGGRNRTCATTATASSRTVAAANSHAERNWLTTMSKTMPAA